jgi:hypothetical protein
VLLVGLLGGGRGVVVADLVVERGDEHEALVQQLVNALAVGPGLGVDRVETANP